MPITPFNKEAFSQLPVASPLPDDVSVSFEFFPPATDGAATTLWRSIQRLAPLNPAYVSVTYGAGGTTRERTHATVARLLKETDLVPAAHLTCVGAGRDDIDSIAKQYWETGVRHLVALRGDPPKGADRYEPYPGGYAYASDLIAGLKKVADFRISAAAYPEVHPEAPDAAFDLDNLKRKVDAGADEIITQYFFDNDVYLRFLDKVAAAGIDVPIIPGIMPVLSFPKVARFSAMCGASIPKWLSDLFEGLDEDDETSKLVAASVAAEQCRALHAQGIKQFHFYTLNQADLVYAICHVLGVRPKTPEPAAGAVAATG